MRKLVVATFVGLFVGLLFAAPAFAQRDPFDPLISESAGTGTETGGDGTTDGDGTGTTGDDVQVDGTGGETLANTGADAEPWLVAAYALIAIGMGAVVLSKVARQPA